MIRRNVEIEGRLIDDLLDLARIARGQLRLELQPVDAYEVLCSSLQTCRWEIEQRSQRAVLEGRPDECWMHADPTRMQQVVWNVLRNAINILSAEVEEKNIDLRVNFFNVFNQLNLSPFGSNSDPTRVTLPTFGTAVSGLAGRVGELQVRFSF